MYTYQEENRYFAQISTGLEDYGAEELRELGAENVNPVFRGIHFEADLETIYKINYNSRLLSRVLAPIKTFKCHSTKYLFRIVQSINWKDFLSTDETFAIFANTSNSSIRHSQYAALCVKDAIADFFSDEFGKRPNVDKYNPDVWISLHIESDNAVLSIDTSGGSLHKRGYRKEALEAPMIETLAAGIIRISGWDGGKPLYDPMCGSGTLLCEAIMSYCRIPSGYFRDRFGFECLPNFDRNVWSKVKKESNSQIRDLPENLIFGSDISSKAIRLTEKNIRGILPNINLSLLTKDFREIDTIKDSIIVTNPPYGIRMKSKNDLGSFYKEIGDFLKQKCTNSTAFIYFGERQYLKNIGLRASMKMPLSNGGLDGRLGKFEIY